MVTNLITEREYFLLLKRVFIGATHRTKKLLVKVSVVHDKVFSGWIRGYNLVDDRDQS